jgi:2-dehydro-3-deoxyphosphogluconate aldolase/(4S)-4-hydroxy-2-oxoglutarate aldolase
MIDRFRKLPLLGILRGGDFDVVDPLVECVVGAGLETFEITLNTPGALAMIERMRVVAGDRLQVGAGTVIEAEQVGRALDAGATFIVSPTLDPAVVAECVRRRVPTFPGAFTPTEIHAAWRAGAAMVKLFPAKAVGPAYIKEVKGPFAEIDILACGGVSADNLADFFAAGASAVAFGGSVFRPEWIAAGAFDRIGAEVRRLVSAFRGR